ncbi:MAG: serine protease [Methylacidiphilales bacterium]|nr:serine protease [Candidatus Methylacidiphilales bacterium]
MKRILCLILVCISPVCWSEPAAITAQSPLPAPTPAKPSLIYVIPIRDDIDTSMVFIVRRGIKEAIDKQADAVILHMDTNGGRIDNTEEIIAILNHFQHQDQLYTYIDTKAFSAGAFIASATHKIYMAPSAVIGAATPIIMSSGGGGVETVSKSVEEKMTSAVRGLVRANAERQGHNPAVFDAMVDREQGLLIDGKELLPKGKLLTLTSKEAEARYGNPPQPLLSAGTVSSLDAFITEIGGGQAKVLKIEPTGFEQLGRFIVMISPFLLAGALLCGYIEFKTGGFGVFGISAVALALVFFFGQYIAGLSGYEYVMMFFFGVLLLAIELFVLPGHILPGLAGAALILISILKAMVDKYPTDPVMPTMPQLEIPMTKLGISFAITLAGMWVLAKVLPKTPLYHRLVLQTVNPTTTAEEPSGIGVGDTGMSLTLLRPSGTADFGHGPVDVITLGDFIQSGQRIRVIQTEGGHIIVEAA